MVGQGYLCNGPYNLGLNEDTDMDTLSFYNQISDSIKRGIIGYSVRVGRELRHFPVREFYRAVNYAKNMDGILMYEEHSDRKGYGWRGRYICKSFKFQDMQITNAVICGNKVQDWRQIPREFPSELIKYARL